MYSSSAKYNNELLEVQVKLFPELKEEEVIITDVKLIEDDSPIYMVNVGPDGSISNDLVGYVILTIMVRLLTNFQTIHMVKKRLREVVEN